MNDKQEDDNTCYVAPDAWQKLEEAERKAIGRKPDDPLIGLALSGGGIRSASFSLGALQALVASGRLRHVDYMSTVSGGGYIGSALTWFTKYAGDDEGTPLFGVTESDFPLGAKEAAALRPTPACPDGRVSEAQRELNRRRTAQLDHLRQHGNYLRPGSFAELISLIWMILQSMLLPLIVYFFVLFLPLAALAYWLNQARIDLLGLAFFLAAIIAAFALFGLPVANIVTRLASWQNGDKSGFLRTQYKVRKFERNYISVAAVVIAFFTVIGLVPDINRNFWSTLTIFSAVSVGVGLFATLGQLTLQIRSIRLFGGRSGSILVVIASIGLVFGLLSLAYQTVHLIHQWYHGSVADTMVTLVAAFVLAGGFGWFQNINLFSLHRLYRDRLMETFLPDFWDDDPVGPSENARDANAAFLSTMFAQDQGPYHIINANIVLTGSSEPRYRGRGGTNFVLSPLYCGSDATGWRRSDHWKMHAGCMTLPTAMAISGAAINPRTGSIDRSPLREPLLSFLMSLTNLRLGLWALNPRVEQACQCAENGDIERNHAPPNFLKPGISQGLWPGRHDEDKTFIELTDGAHFDNTGLYELIRRQVRLIIMVDGTADKDINYQSLASALERIRVDFGVQVRFEEGTRDLQGLLPSPDSSGTFVRKYGLAERGYAIARIDYQPHNDHLRSRRANDESEDGTLIVIKSTMIESLPADVLGYKSANKDFPNESTADQFFDEVQLEAYRELGYRVTKDALDDFRVTREFNRCRYRR